MRCGDMDSEAGHPTQLKFLLWHQTYTSIITWIWIYKLFTDTDNLILHNVPIGISVADTVIIEA